MKIFIDDKPLKSGHAVRGIGSYTRNLMDALKKQNEIKLVDNISDADIVHYPYFDLFFTTIPLLKSKPTVVTVFDTIPLIYPKYYPVGIRGRLNFLLQKRKLKDADSVLTISETSKKDIVRFLNIPQEEIHVVHLAAGESFKKLSSGDWGKRVRKKYNLPEKFILYVGDVNYNKNVEGLIKVFAQMTKDIKDVNLVLVGRGFVSDTKESKEILQLIKKLDIEDKVIKTDFIPDEDLVYFYNLALVYCQPSFYEGFGLPVFEAMACGCPVVAAKTQALVEIAEGVCLLVDPKDLKDISMGLFTVLNNKETRDKLIKEGLSQVKKFSWRKVAEETIKVYQKALDV